MPEEIHIQASVENKKWWQKGHVLQ